MAEDGLGNDLRQRRSVTRTATMDVGRVGQAFRVDIGGFNGYVAAGESVRRRSSSRRAEVRRNVGHPSLASVVISRQKVNSRV